MGDGEERGGHRIFRDEMARHSAHVPRSHRPSLAFQVAFEVKVAVPEDAQWEVSRGKRVPAPERAAVGEVDGQQADERE
jgi:hypothetical protein